MNDDNHELRCCKCFRHEYEVKALYPYIHEDGSPTFICSNCTIVEQPIKGFDAPRDPFSQKVRRVTKLGMASAELLESAVKKLKEKVASKNSETEVNELLTEQYGPPVINLGDFNIDPKVILKVPKKLARKYQLIPITCQGRTLVIAMADPTNGFAVEELELATQYEIEVVAATEESVDEAIEYYYDLPRFDGGDDEISH